MKFDVSDISFLKIKMLQFHTFPATYRKRLQREGAINHFYGNIIFCYFGFMRGEKEGLLIGFSCGLLCDIFFGSFLGFYAMVMMYIGFVNGKFSRIFYPEDIKLPLALIIVSDISYGLICYILMFLLRGRFHFPYYFTSVILPEALYTIVVTIILYPLILKINQKLEEKEKRSAQKFVS